MFLLLACTQANDTATPEPEGLSVLGQGSHSVEEVQFDQLADDGDGLAEPRDLAFNPKAPGELWIVNRATNGVTILFDAGTAEQSSTSFVGSAHFLAQPSALAFGDNGAFATSQEEDEKTQGPNGTPADFMGPTLWTGDSSIFNGQHESHLDMLHNSPNAAGIAWEEDNTYWVFDGWNEALTRYAFHGDHDLGGTDHSDGELARYVEGEVSYSPDVPSHMVYDPASALLYVADSGNGRVAALDTTTGERDGTVGPNYDGTTQVDMRDASLVTLVGAGEFGMGEPSGIALVDDILFVTDISTGNILAFDLDGELVDWMDTGLGSGALMGIEADESGNLYVVDAVDDAVYRISPL